jgi:hypothetical protein
MDRTFRISRMRPVLLCKSEVIPKHKDARPNSGFQFPVACLLMLFDVIVLREAAPQLSPSARSFTI